MFAARALYDANGTQKSSFCTSTMVHQLHGADLSTLQYFPRPMDRAELLHAPRLKLSSAGYVKLSGNEFADLNQSLKNIVEILLKSAVCPGGFCPGGVLLTEVEASPLQVI